MNITIVGGGTAGWITAYFLDSIQPNCHNITVIESSKIGILGAGEGSTGFFTNMLNGHFFPRVQQVDDFISKCDATNKIGIEFHNWLGKNDKFFSPLDGSPSCVSMDDIIFKYVISEYGNNKAHLASRLGLDYEHRTNFNKIDSLHFDAHKVGKFFKEICEKDGVKTIDAIVTDVATSNEGIEYLTLDNGSIIESDMFFDCSGFARVLMKELNDPWISYSDKLPLNAAMPFLVQYEENEYPDPWTRATALNAGWMWDIPLKTRRGCGYVYNSNFLSPQEAQQEVEQYLNKKIEPIKHLTFDPGRGTNFWIGNTISVGLSSCFVEPLQATSIHTTIAQLALFGNDFLQPSKEKTCLEVNKNSYNRKCSQMYEKTLDFISLHYQCGREDTPFWKHVKNNNYVTDYAKEILEISKNRVIGYHESTSAFGIAAMALWNWTIAGFGLFNEKSAKEDLERKLVDRDAGKWYAAFKEHMYGRPK